MPKFASLCILAYKRPALLQICINSLLKTIDYPCEIIVNLDGGDSENIVNIQSMLRNKIISKIILSNGENRGVGRSFENCLGVAEGDYVFKIDADLKFQPGWLSGAIKILDSDTEIGAVGLFDYNKWDPLDSRFRPEENIIEKKNDHFIVKDFVSSIYGFRWGWRYKDPIRSMVIPDDGLHQILGKKFGKLALYHMVENTAFGVGKSTYVSGTNEDPHKTVTYDKPFIFKIDAPSE